MDIEHVCTPEFDSWIRRALECPTFEERWSSSAVRAVLFHGTCRNMDRLDPKMSDCIESNLGRGLYLSNSIDDVNFNYANADGPDLQNKIQRLTERIESESECDEEVENARSIAEMRSMDHSGAIWPSFVFLENPIIIGGPNETYFESGLEIDVSEYLEAAREQLAEEYGDDFTEGDVESEARFLAEDAGEEYEVTGGLAAILEALEEISGREGVSGLEVDRIRGDLEAFIWDGGPANDILDRLYNSDGLQYAEDYSDEETAGDLAGRELLRMALESAGYDGFVDFEVDRKFGSSRESGQKMLGVDPDTVHVVAFRKDQVQSVFSAGFEPKPECEPERINGFQP